ncbi:MAG: hypothetical protein GYB64_14535, partial [Chloroflexi bacterium]|nr:hypothetical protein [Chloroflexota bacterium]
MPDIQRTEPRADARITLPDGSVWTAPVGTPLVAFLEAAYPDLLPTVWDEPGSDMLIAAGVDGRLREMTMPG